MSGQRTATIVAVCVAGSLTTMVALGAATPERTSSEAPPRTQAAPTSVDPTAPQPAPTRAPQVRGTVLGVVDGDTVDVVQAGGERTRVRVLGIDTPETVVPDTPVQCWGPEATTFAERTLLGQQVRLESDPAQDEIDSDGHTLAYVVLADGTDYSVAAAEAGVARSAVYDGQIRRHAEIAEAQGRAQASGIGLWGAPCEGRAVLPPPPPPPPPPLVAPEPSSDCDPNYEGACVPIAGDVDCAGGSGNGPEYVHGPVRVVGDDIYGLDRDGDGGACE